jgi:hypothetical protein
VEAPGKVVEGEGVCVMERPEPYILGVQTICGGTTADDCPIVGEIVATTKFHAFFEPKIHHVFRLTHSRGRIEAGARVFPFKVVYTPRDTRPIETLLVVDMGDSEICVKVCGSIGGFQGENWGRRRV